MEMSDVAKDAERPKRTVKMSGKDLEYRVTTHQEERSAKCKQAKRCMEHMNALMALKENVDSIKNK